MTETHDVAIAGGGIAGLTVAWRLRRHCPERSIVVLEAGDRPGGKVRTEVIEHDAGRFLVERGADSMLNASKPWARQLCSELGLDDDVISSQPAPISTAVWSQGRPVDLPAGLTLLAPTQPDAFLQSPLLSPEGRARALREPEIAVRDGDDDESLGNFVTRRFGREHLDGIAEPLLAGIYNANPDELSLLATFPNFRKLEQEYGSVTRGVAALPPPAGGSPFFTLRGGVEQIPATLAQQLGSVVRTAARVERLERAGEGGYRLSLSSGEAVRARSIVLATPISSARALLAPVAPETSRWFDRMRTGRSGSVVLAWPDTRIGRPLAGFGMVVPKREAQPFNAITVHSRKYEGRAPAGWSLLRFYFGGYRSPQMLELDDEALVRAACDFAERAIGATGFPAFARVTRWQEGNSIYQVGHWDTIAGLESALPDDVYVAGTPYRGPGIPDVIRTSTDLASRIAASLVPAAV